MTAERLNELLYQEKAILFVCHNKDKNFVVVSLDLINDLPKNLIQGYYHQSSDKYNGMVFQNIILNTKGIDGSSNILLHGRITFETQGKISILPENWYLKYIDSKNHLKDTPQNTKFSILKNKNRYDAHIMSMDYILIVSSVSARRYVTHIQETITNLNPTKPFITYLPSFKIEEFTKAIKYKLPDLQELFNIYGEEFTIKFFEIFNSLFCPNQIVHDRYVIPEAHKFLAKLNGYFKNGNFKTLLEGPSLELINDRIRQLFTVQGTFDKNSFFKFIWRYSEFDNSFRYIQENYQGFLEPFTFKMWLENLHNLIVNYVGDDNSINNVKSIVEDFAAKSGYASYLDINNKWTFSYEEANLCIIKIL